MYGIIMTAVITGVVGIQIIKRKTSKISMAYQSLSPIKKKGNAIFNRRDAGLGWALVVVRVRPIYILIGAGFECVYRIVWSIAWNLSLWRFEG
jgi:hypothetical protein